MEFGGWDIIITLIIASYGAVVSTISIWYTRKEHKREVKVTLSFGLIKQISVSPPQIFLEALNIGSKTVTLSSFGLNLPNKKNMYFPNPNSNAPFPHELLEGKSVSVWIDAKELAKNLKQEGYSGMISYKGFYKDAIGNVYRSKEEKFDIEGWSK